MTKKPKRPSVGVAMVCRVYGIEPEDMNKSEKALAAKITDAIRRAVGKRDFYWIATLARWSHVQPTIESHRMIVKTMTKQARISR